MTMLLDSLPMLLSVASLETLAFLGLVLTKGLIVLVVVAVLLRLMGTRGAALRHAAWSVAFVALLALPLASAFLPAWNVPGSSEALGRSGERVMALSEHMQAQGAKLVASAVGVFGGKTAAPAPSDPLPSAPTMSPSVAPPASPADGAHASLSAPSVAQTAAPAPSSWLLRLLVGGWLAGALLLLGHLATGLLRAGRLLATAEPVGDAAWLKAEREIRAQLGLSRVVDLRHSDAVEVPMTIGVRRPVVLLPEEATTWSDERCRIVLLHEMAHISRGDYVWHLLAMAARALHWPNPLAWWAASQHVIEREHACDDRVLNAGVAPTSYADELVSVARDLLHRPALAGAVLPMARPSELRTRIRAILNQAARPKPSRAHATGVALIVGVLLLPLAAFRFDAPTPAEALPSMGESLMVVEAEPEELGSMRALAEPAALAPMTPPPAPESTPEPPAAVPVLSTNEPLSDSLRAVRKAAIQAIGQLPAERAVPLLIDIAESEAEVELRETAIFWLSQQGTPEVLELFDRIARDDADEDVREQAVFAISQVGGTEAETMLMRFVQDEALGSAVRENAVFWLGQTAGAGALPTLERLARTDRDADVREKAVFAISQIGGDMAVAKLSALALDTALSTETRETAVFWLGEVAGAEVIDVLSDLALNDADEDVQDKAVFAMSQIGGARAFDVLASIARDASNDAHVREKAVFWLGESGDPRAGDVLVELLRTGN